MKIILISIFALCATLTIGLLSVEGIDYALHYNTYKQIDNFFSEIKTARIKDKCYANYTSIYTNRKNSLGKEKFPPPIVLSPEVYDKIFSSCIQYKKDLTITKIPGNISADQQDMLKKVLLSTTSVIDSLLDDLNRLNKCKGDAACLQTSQQILDKEHYDRRKAILDGNLAAIQILKRPSFKYYFVLRPLEKDLKRKFKDEQSRQNLSFK